MSISEALSKVDNHSAWTILFAKVLESREPQANQRASGRLLKLKLAWNTQKNKMSDVKGKEMEQERKGRIKNEDIDSEREHLNYDFIQSPNTLYQRVKNRVEHYKNQGSRVQKNSVVMYSNVITLSEEDADRMGEVRTQAYFRACKDYFSQRFGKDNVVSAKVHMDETAPHMHLHFIPVNEQDRLSARTAMNRQAVNEIHDELTEHLCQQGFDVERGSTKENKTYVKDIHEYKKKEKTLSELDQQIDTKKRLLTDINELQDEKVDLIQKIKNLKKKNRFLQEESEQLQNDIGTYRDMRDVSRAGMKKDEEKYQKYKEAQEMALSTLKTDVDNLEERHQTLIEENEALENSLDDLSERHETMNDMVRKDTRLLFAGLRCALKDMNIKLAAEIKYQRMPEVGIDPDSVDTGRLEDAPKTYIYGIHHHIRKASEPIKIVREDDGLEM